MGFNKNKIMRSAERFLSQGRIPSAIKEYTTIVENDPDDVITQNMLGDLYMKADDAKAAIKCFRQVAEHYHANGYVKKAIAVYNKIHRHEPESLEISLKLADLYHARGSIAEARVHYEKIAAEYEKSGKNVEALAIWEKIAEFAPNNTEVYLKIADYYWQHNQKEAAARAFIEGGTRLAAVNKHEEAIAAFSRALEVIPDDLASTRGYVNSQISLGYPEEAVKTLSEMHDCDPYNADVVFLLADCYLDMDSPSKAEIVITDLISAEPKAHAKLLDVVDYYLKRDDLDSVVRIVATISEQLLVSQKPERLLHLLNEVVVRNPEQIQALRLLARYFSWHKNQAELERILEQLADAAKYNEAVEDERYALSQLLLINPQNERVIERLKDLNGKTASANEPGDLQDADGARIPTFEAYNSLLNGDGMESAVNSAEPAPDNEQYGAGEAEIQLTEADLQTVSDHSGAAEVNTVNAESNSPAPVETVAVNEAAGGEGLNTGKGDVDGQSADGSMPPVIEDSGPGQDALEESGAAPPAEHLSEDAPTDQEAEFAEQIENLKFYIDQGYLGIARQSLDELDLQFGHRNELKEIREILKQATVESGIPSLQSAPASSEDKAPVANLRPESDVVSTETREAVPDAINSQNGSGVTDEESTPREAGDLAAAEPADPAVDSKTDHNDSVPAEDDQASVNPRAAEIEEPEDIKSEVERVAEKTDVINAASLIDDDDAGPAETEPVSEADYDNHYHHGVAYQEMGLLEDAVRELTSALRAIGPNDESGRLMQCCTMLGHCSIGLGLPKEAVKWFSKAFESNDLDENKKMALNYEIGNALMLDGEYQQALDLFEEIHLQDPDYRDLSEQLDECRKQASLVPA